jgi:hypothetical protein
LPELFLGLSSHATFEHLHPIPNICATIALLLLLDFAIPPSDNGSQNKVRPNANPTIPGTPAAVRSHLPHSMPPPSDASDLLAPVCAIVAETRKTPKTYNTIRNDDVALSEVAPGLLPWSAGSLI